MHREKFGELLGRLVDLSEHDILEILEEQFGSGRRFGQIALAWGLCDPRHVWEVWWAQLGGDADADADAQTQRVDLRSVGVDAQSVSHVPRALAERFGVVPLRAMEDHLVLAATEESLAAARAELPARLGMQVRFVLADAGQIREAIVACYPDRPEAREVVAVAA